MKKKRFVWSLASVMMLVLAIGVTAYTEQDPYMTTLWAGQNIDAGTISVWNDGDYLYVKYETTGDWELAETHLAVASSMEALPQTKTGNPKPGAFPYSMEHDPLVAEYTYMVDISGYEPGDTLYIAAHAVVQMATLEQEAPYYASVVIETTQGLKQDGNPVRAQRSVPEQGLEFEDGQSESNFYSLGFGGHLVVGFDMPIVNGPGNDVLIIEDTWGSYPLEKADVYASVDGTEWVLLGTADNTQHQGIHTVSEFDLGALESAMYIKVVDVSDPADFSNIPSADGFDLNAVVALHDYYSVQEETGWGDGEDFPGKNWATYFEYELEEPEDPEEQDEIEPGDFRTQTQGGWGSTANGDNPGTYRDANFDAAFPNGLVIGDAQGFTLTLTSSAAVEAFLPQGGTAMALTQNHVDPVTTEAGVLAGQMTALTLSVFFDLYDADFGDSATNLKDLVVADIASPFFGWTVEQVWMEGNTILAGLPSAYTPSEINEALSSINENFVDGVVVGSFLALP